MKILTKEEAEWYQWIIDNKACFDEAGRLADKIDDIFGTPRILRKWKKFSVYMKLFWQDALRQNDEMWKAWIKNEKD